jgi:hypothetical protein
LKQLALGFHNYEGAKKTLPRTIYTRSGGTAAECLADVDCCSNTALDCPRFCPSPFVMILPFIEQQAVYAQWRWQCGNLRPNAAAGAPAPAPYNRGLARSAHIDTFVCPSDRYEIGISQTNYGTSIGPGFGWTDDAMLSNGMFRRRIEVRFSDVTDGLSNTVLLAERLIADGANGTNSLQDVVTGVAFTGGLNDSTPFPPPNLVEQYGQAGDLAWQAGGNTYSGNCPDFFSCGFATINEAAPPNWKHHDVKQQGCVFRLPGGGVYPARSKHPGGVNAALADASVRFISETIDGYTWQYLGARADGQAVTVP